MFPELALTTFFPRYYMEDAAEIDSYFESSMPNPAVQPLFDEASETERRFPPWLCGAHERGGKQRRFNTAILVTPTGTIVGSTGRSIYLGMPITGRTCRFSIWRSAILRSATAASVYRAFNGIIGMCICNDRRWPETFE